MRTDITPRVTEGIDETRLGEVVGYPVIERRETRIQR